MKKSNLVLIKNFAVFILAIVIGYALQSCNADDSGGGGGGSSAFVGVWTGVVGADAKLTITNTTWTFVWTQGSGQNQGTYTVSNGTATLLHDGYTGTYAAINGSLFGTATVNVNTLYFTQGDTYILTKQ